MRNTKSRLVARIHPVVLYRAAAAQPRSRFGRVTSQSTPMSAPGLTQEAIIQKQVVPDIQRRVKRLAALYQARDVPNLKRVSTGWTPSGCA